MPNIMTSVSRKTIFVNESVLFDQRQIVFGNMINKAQKFDKFVAMWLLVYDMTSALY